MPKKSIREMSRLERRQNSLSARTFHAVLLMAVIICVAAITFGFYLYNDSMIRQYRITTTNMSKTAAGLLNQTDVRFESEKVLDIYDSLTEEERQETGTDAYRVRYNEVPDLAYTEIRQQLRTQMEENDAGDAFIAALDVERNRMIYIIDADPTSEYCPPGTWDAQDPDWMETFLDGSYYRATDRIYLKEPLRAVVDNIEGYGFICTAATPLTEVNGYPVMVFFDVDLNAVVKAGRMFLLQYILIMLLIAVIASLLISTLLKRAVVRPVNQLAEAAQAYSRDKENGQATGTHFQDLDIQTGDELENLSLAMKDMESDLADYVSDLTRVTAEKERINTELNVASTIQEGMIPHIYPAFPERPEFEVYASMQTAKEVGGDFYDYFFIDEDHLGIVMADVSGKGIPAALFMMASKIVISNVSRLMKESPARILAEVNDQICANNPAEMFVTVWLGVLELSTGTLKAANAGHEFPVLRRKNGEYELYKDKHGFVIGGMEGMVYTDYEIHMEPGDSVFQYTDGVTEATDGENRLFGTERMLEALNRDADAPPKKILENITRTVEGFVGDAPQFDDLTMLCLKYYGPEGRKEKGGSAMENNTIQVEALKNNLPEVLEFVEGYMDRMGCPLKAQMQISIAVEEIFVNIASYAYAPNTGSASIRMERTEDPATVHITFEDSGVPYDPLAKEDPDVTLSAEERKIGGLGIYMVKQSMDDLAYEYKDGKNILTISKVIE